MRTQEQNQKLIDQASDDDLIAIATTASSPSVRLAAEMHLRKRYPSEHIDALLQQTK